MNAAGEAQHQTIVLLQEVGGDTRQATVAAIEQFVHGLQRMLHAKAGHHQAQKQGTGDYLHKMK